MNLETFNAQAKRAALYLARPLRLKEIPLPEGDIASVSIDAPPGAAIRLESSSWLSAGFDGVRLIGKGIGRTQIRGNMADGISLRVGRHPGVVQLEGVSVVSGFSRAMNFGDQNFSGKTEPKFALRLIESHVFVPPPEALLGGRAKWGIFGYNYDEFLRDVELDATFASEHARYKHGSAFRGGLWLRVKVRGSGAENDKTRSDSTETAWAGPNVWEIRQKCSYGNWYQTWSDRGGAGIVVQGGASNHLIEDCVFRGSPVPTKSKCIMISADPSSYDIATGKVGVGHGNGDIVVRRTVLSGSMDGYYHNTLLSVYSNDPGQKAARAVLVDTCGAFGPNMILSFRDVPVNQSMVARSNTPEITRYCGTIGVDTRAEATIPTATRLVPVSEGYRA